MTAKKTKKPAQASKTTKTSKVEKKNTPVFGKRESSILLFMVVLACLIFIGWNNPSKPFGFLHKDQQDSSTTGKALIGGEFELTDQNGKRFSSDKLKGKKSLVFFGFTNCPSICPTAMAQITALMDEVDAKKIQPVFITVDADRDTPEAIKEFLTSYYPGFIGLTGTEEELRAVEKAYKVYSNKVETKDAPKGEYTMDHSGLIYVMDENGEYLTHFSGAETTEEMAAGINSY